MTLKYNTNFNEAWKPASTPKISAQAGRKEREYNDPDFQTLATANLHLSASKTRRPTQRNLDRRAIISAILRSRAAAGHRGISRVLSAAERRGGGLTDADRKKIKTYASHISRSDQRRRSIDTVARMQTRRTPEQEAAQSASVRFHDTFHKESYDLYDVVLSHLLDEGYANSVKGAEMIAMNMSENWVYSIVEAIDWKKSEIGFTGNAIPKKKISPKNRYEFEKKRRKYLRKIPGITPPGDSPLIVALRDRAAQMGQG